MNGPIFKKNIYYSKKGFTVLIPGHQPLIYQFHFTAREWICSLACQLWLEATTEKTSARMTSSINTILKMIHGSISESWMREEAAQLLSKFPIPISLSADVGSSFLFERLWHSAKVGIRYLLNDSLLQWNSPDNCLPLVAGLVI